MESKGTELGPRLEIWGGIEQDFIGLRERNCHYPKRRLRVPMDLRVSELSVVEIDNRVVLVFGKRVATIRRVRNVLSLLFRGVQSIDGDNAILARYALVEETGRVINIDDG